MPIPDPRWVPFQCRSPHIFAFVVGGFIATIGLLAVAFVASSGAIAMGIYDVMALPLLFVAGGGAGICIMRITIWLRKLLNK